MSGEIKNHGDAVGLPGGPVTRHLFKPKLTILHQEELEGRHVRHPKSLSHDGERRHSDYITPAC